MITDIVVNVKILRAYFSEQEEICIDYIQYMFKLFEENINQIKYMPYETRIRTINDLLELIGKIIFTQNNFVLFKLFENENDENHFLNVIKYIIEFLTVKDISTCLYIKNTTEKVTLKKIIFKGEQYDQNSLTSLLVLNKLISTIDPFTLNTNSNANLKEIKFIIDFISSQDNKFLKLFKFGKSFFNLSNIFHQITLVNKNNISKIKGENFIKKLFIILNSFDESNIPIEIELDSLSESNLSILINNNYKEKITINSGSLKEEINSNIIYDLSSLCNLYLKFFENELDDLINIENINIYKNQKEKINSRINILEVCVNLLNKKKEFPIFKILIDINLAFFRLNFQNLNFTQLIKLLEIFSKDSFILFYDNNLFAFELYPYIISKILERIQNRSFFDSISVFEIFLYLDKLNFFYTKKDFKNNNEALQISDYELLIDDLLKEMKSFFLINHLNLKISSFENKIVRFYIDSISYINSNLNHEEIYDYKKNDLFYDANFLFFKNVNEEDDIAQNIDRLNIFLSFYYNDKILKIETKRWNDHMNYDFYFLNLNNLDDLFKNLFTERKELFSITEISSNKILRKEKNHNFSNHINNYYADFYIFNQNKINVKSFIFSIYKLLGLKKEFIENKLININNLELLNYLKNL